MSKDTVKIWALQTDSVDGFVGGMDKLAKKEEVLVKRPGKQRRALNTRRA